MKTEATACKRILKNLSVSAILLICAFALCLLLDDVFDIREPANVLLYFPYF